MPYYKMDDLQIIEPMPGFRGRFVHSEHVTLANWNIAAGSMAPRHSHPHEQMTFVISGEFELTIDDETRRLIPGISAVIPSGVEHSGVAVTDCLLVDVFYPVREDYR